MVNKFTQKAQKALTYALTVADELGHSYVGTEHLLLGLLAQKESIAARILTLRGASESKLRQSIIDYVGKGNKGGVCSDDMTPRLRNIIESAAAEAEKSRIRYVGTEHLLIALINRRDSIAFRLLEAQGVCCTEIKADLAAYVGSAPSRQKEDSTREEETKKSKKHPLLAYGKDLTEAAMQGKTDPVLCRESETERLIRILCRRSKNNPCLVGEPGVGKTAVVEGLAERIALGKVPDELKKKRIITLDISSMIAGAKYRGEFEDRIKAAVDAVQKDKNIILFVDEMHVMVGAGAAEGAIDASNILKPSLARGDLRMIGATTPDEYRTHIEKDPAFERRFQPIYLEEPSEEEARSILRGLRERYEAYHSLSISDDAIDTAVRLSARYIHDRFLPDKAIDLIDEAAAKIKLSTLCSSNDTQAECLYTQKEAAIKAGDFEEASKIAEKERELCSSHSVALLQKQDDTTKLTLSADDVASVISEQTGIPCQTLLLSDIKRLHTLEEQLSKRIIGQESAIATVSNAIRRGRTGLADPKRPIGSFLFLGGTGVGKTELCRAIAETVYEGTDALIKLDMSEYMEKQSVSKLIGAPPGYVGYGEGGMLTQKVRRQPYCVILFDEIEKAHPDVFNILLQILEDGTLTDTSGRRADFSSTLIIMTSNLLSAENANPKILGFGDAKQSGTGENIRADKRLREFFRPELLNRIDEVVLFSGLGERELEKIAALMLGELAQRAERIGLEVDVDTSVAPFITKKCLEAGTSDGARGIRREILERIENPLSDHILKSKINSSLTIKVTVKEGELCLK